MFYVTVIGRFYEQAIVIAINGPFCCLCDRDHRLIHSKKTIRTEVQVVKYDLWKVSPLTSQVPTLISFLCSGVVRQKEATAQEQVSL